MITETLKVINRAESASSKKTKTDILSYSPGSLIGSNSFGVMCAYVDFRLDVKYSDGSFCWRIINGDGHDSLEGV